MRTLHVAQALLCFGLVVLFLSSSFISILSIRVSSQSLASSAAEVESPVAIGVFKSGAELSPKDLVVIFSGYVSSGDAIMEIGVSCLAVVADNFWDGRVTGTREPITFLVRVEAEDLIDSVDV